MGAKLRGIFVEARPPNLLLPARCKLLKVRCASASTRITCREYSRGRRADHKVNAVKDVAGGGPVLLRLAVLETSAPSCIET